MELLEGAGCRFTVAVEEADVDAEIIATRRQSLPRIDCNRFPHGDATSDIG
jgi:hypothetical protein